MTNSINFGVDSTPDLKKHNVKQSQMIVEYSISYTTVIDCIKYYKCTYNILLSKMECTTFFSSLIDTVSSLILNVGNIIKRVNVLKIAHENFRATMDVFRNLH